MRGLLQFFHEKQSCKIVLITLRKSFHVKNMVSDVLCASKHLLLHQICH